VNLTLEAVPPGSADLVAWPENVILDTLDGQPTYAEGIRVALEHVRCDLLLSAFAVAEGGRGTHASVFHLAPDGRVRARHDKLLLLPGTEYVPFESALRRVSPRAAEAWAGLVARIVGVRADGVPGREMQVFTLATSSGTTRFGAPTCFENTSAALVRSCARSGARFLVNVTSEGRVGASASEHVLRIAQLRAVETRSSVLRAGNVGITAFIDPLGDVQSVLREPRGVLADRVALGSGGPTPYTRAGDWLAMLCCLATLPLVFIRRTSA
jgi:apolipoprotein N-acyltransferase